MDMLMIRESDRFGRRCRYHGRCLLLLLCFILSFCAHLSAEQEAPNVLFIAVDDLNDWVSTMGAHPQAHTPNIDRLADQGVLFANAHAPEPLCNASRAALMSGLRPSDTGVYTNYQPLRKAAPEVTTLPQHFMNNGYTARRAGKIFHGRYPEPTSWDKAFPNLTTNRPDDPMPDNQPLSATAAAGGFDWGPIDVDNEKMGDHKVVDWIIKQMKQDKDRPFFLAAGIFKPHLPWYVPEQYFEDLDIEDIQLPHVPSNVLEDLPDRAKEIAGLANDHQRITKHGEWKDAVRGYLASIRFADAQVGRLLDALNETGLRDDTIVVLWGDHGWHLGEKKHWRKFSLWEQSTRVPLIVSAPEGTPGLPGGAPAGAVTDVPVSLMDLYPTLSELAGLDIPDHVQGRTLVPLLGDPDKEVNRTVLTTFGYREYAVRTKNFRYIMYGEEGTEELYDHRRDPNEWINRADHPAYQDVKKRLKRRIPDDPAKPSPKLHEKWWKGKGN